MGIDDTRSVEGSYVLLYCTKWRSGVWTGVTDALRTDSQTLKDRAAQLLIKYKSGALVTQFLFYYAVCCAASPCIADSCSRLPGRPCPVEKKVAPSNPDTNTHVKVLPLEEFTLSIINCRNYGAAPLQ